MSPQQDALNKALEFASSKSFHRSLTVPASESRGPLRVTYATTRNFEHEDAAALPTVLYHGAMVASRYMVYSVDHIAETTGVKFIFVDRPGFGGSTPVPLNKRVDVWLEIVPLLLAELGVEHVVLASHSAGTVYLLNTMLRLPHIMHPSRPLAIMLAPWVHPAHSNVALWSAAFKLPVSIIGSFGALQKFIVTNIIPVSSYSSGLLETITSAFRNGQSTDHADDGTTFAAYGIDKATWKAIEKLQIKYFFAEDPMGINDETLVCLKRSGLGTWGVCEDFELYVRDLAQRRSSASMPPVEIHAFFSESDIMIGKGGQRYFEDCFQSADLGGSVQFHTVTIPDTNHDSVVSPEKQAWGKILEQVKTGV